MDEENLSTEAWLVKELAFINVEMAETLNGRLKAALESCDDEKQEIVLKFPLDPWQVNGLGTLHGGMANTMMDLAMSMAVYCFSRQNIPPTISMATNYLRPIPMEQHVFVRAKLTSLGKRNATAYCEAIIPGNGKVACTAIGTYAVIVKS
jgi:uncharacterized protein (TIGR00369 family)